MLQTPSPWLPAPGTVLDPLPTPNSNLDRSLYQAFFWTTDQLPNDDFSPVRKCGLSLGSFPAASLHLFPRAFHLSLLLCISLTASCVWLELPGFWPRMCRCLYPYSLLLSLVLPRFLLLTILPSVLPAQVSCWRHRCSSTELVFLGKPTVNNLQFWDNHSQEYMVLKQHPKVRRTREQHGGPSAASDVRVMAAMVTLSTWGPAQTPGSFPALLFSVF